MAYINMYTCTMTALINYLKNLQFIQDKNNKAFSIYHKICRNFEEQNFISVNLDVIQEVNEYSRMSQQHRGH